MTEKKVNPKVNIDDLVDIEEFGEHVTEAQLNDYLDSVCKIYKEELDKIEEGCDYLKEEQEKFPVKYLQKDEFEGFMLRASHLKHRSIDYYQMSTSLNGKITADIAFIESIMKLELAEDHLADKFDKITADLRDSYVKSNKRLKKLVKIKSSLNAHALASEKLVRAFDSDEVDYRRFLDIKSALMGLK